MDIKLKEINSYEKEIMINLNWNEIEKDFEKAIRKFSKRIKLPGFRPGKIPRKVLMNQFQSAIEADFIESSLQLIWVALVMSILIMVGILNLK